MGTGTLEMAVAEKELHCLAVGWPGLLWALHPPQQKGPLRCACTVPRAERTFTTSPPADSF